MYHANINENQGFYFGYELDSEGEPIVEANNFRVAFTSKKLLSYFNITSFPVYHGTLSKEEYMFHLNVVNARWTSYHGVIEFKDYFWSEWVDGRFKNWQIWNTPCPGVATTNSCIESFNKQLKFVYTGYELYTLSKFLDICFDKLINQYSCQPKDFCYYRPPTFDMIVQANNMLTTNPNPFNSGGVNVFYINSKSKVNIYRLIVEDHQTYPGFKFVFCNCIGIVKFCY